jgi:hypothetical protein
MQRTSNKTCGNEYLKENLVYSKNSKNVYHNALSTIPFPWHPNKSINYTQEEIDVIQRE